MKSIYAARFALGLCPQCGRPRDTPMIRCSKCNTYFREYMRRCRKSMPGKNTDNARAYRKRNRRAGLCPTCGQTIDEARYKRCSKCRKQARGYYKKDLQKKVLDDSRT